ncbi:unnamed protein product [Caenorhabditis sp. 36 PRJEB53466]|nr:unnamed protein product [Caenorhabditis sp. 36 PRJEB53466]
MAISLETAKMQYEFAVAAMNQTKDEFIDLMRLISEVNVTRAERDMVGDSAMELAPMLDMLKALEPNDVVTHLIGARLNVLFRLELLQRIELYRILVARYVRRVPAW